VDAERQTRDPCRRNVPAEDFGLHIARRRVVEVIESRFANPDHLGMGGEFDQPFDADIRLLLRFVRMSAHRAVDLRVGLGDGPHLAEVTDTRTDGDHQPNVGRRGTGDQRLRLSGEVWEI
jgi:hypothetical protein